jgi:hypothetical protein
LAVPKDDSRGAIRARLFMKSAFKMYLSPFSHFFLSQSIDRHIHHNPVQPGPKSRISAKRANGSMHANKRFLGNVFSLIVISDDSIGDVVRLLHVALDEKTKGLAASFLRIENQSPLVFGGHPEVSLYDVLEVRQGRQRLR